MNVRTPSVANINNTGQVAPAAPGYDGRGDRSEFKAQTKLKKASFRDSPLDFPSQFIQVPLHQQDRCGVMR